jgi:hypothetical protein
MNDADVIIRRLASRLNAQSDIRRALEWYADIKNYAAPARKKAGRSQTVANIKLPVVKDMGRKARLALRRRQA